MRKACSRVVKAVILSSEWRNCHAQDGRDCSAGAARSRGGISGAAAVGAPPGTPGRAAALRHTAGTFYIFSRAVSPHRGVANLSNSISLTCHLLECLAEGSNVCQHVNLIKMQLASICSSCSCRRCGG